LVCHSKGRTYIEVSENKVLRGIFVTKREGLAGGLRTVCHEESDNVYASLNITMVIKSRRMSGRACSTHGRYGKCIQSDGKRPFGRPRRIL
jgi:hypothetical protein